MNTHEPGEPNESTLPAEPVQTNELNDGPAYLPPNPKDRKPSPINKPIWDRNLPNTLLIISTASLALAGIGMLANESGEIGTGMGAIESTVPETSPRVRGGATDSSSAPSTEAPDHTQDALIITASSLEQATNTVMTATTDLPAAASSLAESSTSIDAVQMQVTLESLPAASSDTSIITPDTLELATTSSTTTSTTAPPATAPATTAVSVPVTAAELIATTMAPQPEQQRNVSVEQTSVSMPEGSSLWEIGEGLGLENPLELADWNPQIYDINNIPAGTIIYTRPGIAPEGDYPVQLHRQPPQTQPQNSSGTSNGNESSSGSGSGGSGARQITAEYCATQGGHLVNPNDLSYYQHLLNIGASPELAYILEESDVMNEHFWTDDTSGRFLECYVNDLDTAAGVAPGAFD